jgi:small subunit ribosomal protein S1
MAELSSRVGQSLTLQLIEADSSQNRLVFSERLAQGPRAAAATLLRSLRPGDVRQGRITNLTSFGAFVDLGGVEGLVHISEISWQRVGHPSDVLEWGQDVQVFVIDVEPGQGRIRLSIKRLQPDPWLDVEDRYRVGDEVEGIITNVVSFGAFARLEKGLEGLIHVSELAEGEVLHPRNIVREGDEVRLQVLNVDSRQRRLGLRLRRIDKPQEPGGDGREPQT